MDTAARSEIEQAFTGYQETVAGIAESGDWAAFADLFTPDATYEEHAFGSSTGREATAPRAGRRSGRGSWTR